ncbi:MAG: PEP-CTERM sorting domain-containing protein [Gemmatimonadales bacterium]|nr:PEP-CTERM sorting domain-containing protein [Gemmatimonadales bacterium]
MRLRHLVGAALAFVLTTPAAAQYSSTLPQFNGTFASSAPWPSFSVGQFGGTPTSNITFAQISGTFGNSDFATSTGAVDVKLDGILVAQCVVNAPCWNGGGPYNWSYTFAPSEYSIFADGFANLTADQTAGFVVRLGPTQLTIRYDQQTVVPEPSTYALLATGLVGIVAVARKRQQA